MKAIQQNFAVVCRDIEHAGSLKSTKEASELLDSSLLSALQTSQVLNISTYAELKHELIVL